MPKLLFTLLILISIPTLFFYGKNNFIYPIDEIDVIAQESNYDYEKINAVISTLQGENLLSVDINELRKSIISDAWIKDVEITKSFPSKLLITIIQHKPLALYNSKILTLDGTVIEDNLSNIVNCYIENNSLSRWGDAVVDMSIRQEYISIGEKSAKHFLEH